MNKNAQFISILLLSSLGATTPIVQAADSTEVLEKGKYLVTIGGCNDCHTAGYLMTDGNVSMDKWLTGSDFGWNGPWGTTYPPNLRLFVKDLSEDQWLQEAKTLKRRPPMPWFNLNVMKDDDLRAIYQFIKSLGEPGAQAPAYLPPDVAPPMPFASFPAPPPVAKK